MSIILAIKSKTTGKIKSIGNIQSLLTLLIAVSKALAETISKEKEISIEEAENFVVECIAEGIKTVKSR